MALATKLNIHKKLLPVKNCRNISKENMVHNNLMPKIEIDPETFKVKVDGKLVTTDPAEKLSRWHDFTNYFRSQLSLHIILYLSIYMTNLWYKLVHLKKLKESQKEW